jgi:quinol-cytochrome oxidoreductase complex cytochrome b subunit/mono/diheme cytochrome c family protein
MQSKTMPRASNKIFYLALMAGLSFLLIIGLPAISVFAASGAPTATPGPLPPASPLLQTPEAPKNPLAADHGAVIYWSHCMACHGDKGQGLTEEWRKVGFGTDMDCWTSQCHASETAAPKYKFPRQVPPVIGASALLRFATARDLYRHIQAAMPWWDPGALAKKDAWALAAYLLRENGHLSSGLKLDARQAVLIPVHLPVRSQESEQASQYALVGLLMLSVMALATFNQINAKKEPPLVNVSGMRPNFFHHLHPPSLPAPQARWRYTLGAGGLAVFLTLVVGVTGALEMYFYIPTPEQAGLSIQTITFLVPFGGLVRGLHFWAAQALVVVSGIHLLRVVLTGAYSRPRRFNFLLGMVLFVLIFFMNFTGYILRWDDGIHWAMIVGTNLLKSIPVIGSGLYGLIVGGETPGLAMLTRFYAWHIFGLTIIAIVFLVWHIFRVRRDGGISAPAPAQRSDQSRITRFELVRREALAMLIASAWLILLATLIPPPLAAPIRDASLPLNPEVRAPWFFLWVQQLLRYGDAFWMGIIVPVMAILTVSLLPYILPNLPPDQKGRWFPRAGRAAQVMITVAAFAWLTLTILEFVK